MSRELKIGIFLACTLAIMAVFIFIVGDLGRLFQKPGYPLTVMFDTAAGVDVGVLVRVAGIKVGRVKRIELDGTKARFTLVITPSFRVPRGSRATQAALGLLGEKYIEILPGSGPGYCDPGDELEGLTPVGFDQIGKLFVSIGDEIKDVSATLKDMVGSESRTYRLSQPSSTDSWRRIRTGSAVRSRVRAKPSRTSTGRSRRSPRP